MKPGPGNYDHGADLSRSAPRYGFGSERRPDVAKTKNTSPSPGAYNAKCFMSTAIQDVFYQSVKYADGNS